MHIAFVDLEKAFDQVPSDGEGWVLRKLGAEEWLVDIVHLILDIYEVILESIGLSVMIFWSR